MSPAGTSDLHRCLLPPSWLCGPGQTPRTSTPEPALVARYQEQERPQRLGRSALAAPFPEGLTAGQRSHPRAPEGTRKVEVTPPTRHAPAPRRRRASPGSSGRSLGSPQPFKLASGKRGAAATAGASPPAQAPRLPLPLHFQLFRGGSNGRISILLPELPAPPADPRALKGMGKGCCHLAECVHCNLEWAARRCLPRQGHGCGLLGFPLLESSNYYCYY